MTMAWRESHLHHIPTEDRHISRRKWEKEKKKKKGSILSKIFPCCSRKDTDDEWAEDDELTDTTIVVDKQLSRTGMYLPEVHGWRHWKPQQMNDVSKVNDEIVEAMESYRNSVPMQTKNYGPKLP